MKITQIVPSLQEQHGGPSKSVLALSTALAQTENRIELCATDPGPGDDRTEGRLKVRVFHRDWPDRICRSTALAAALRATDADVIHHHSIWLRTLHYAHRAAITKGATFVVSPRGMMNTWAWRHRSWRKRLARAFIHPGALAAVDGWHATSPEEAEEIRSLGFKQPVCVAPNGVNEPAFGEFATAAAH